MENLFVGRRQSSRTGLASSACEVFSHRIFYSTAAKYPSLFIEAPAYRLLTWVAHVHKSIIFDDALRRRFIGDPQWHPRCTWSHPVLISENEKGLTNYERGRIMEVIIRSPGNQLEEVVFECPDLTWHQVFCELHRLSRVRQVRLTTKGPGRYAVSIPAASNSFI